MTRTTTRNIAKRLAACIRGFAGCEAFVETVDGLDYVITRGTGEGYDFAYRAAEVEAWLDGRADAPADYSDDFCDEVRPVDDVAVAFALAVLGYRIGRAGCDLVLDGVRVESAEGLEGCANKTPMRGTIVGMSQGYVEILWASGDRSRQRLDDSVSLVASRGG